MARPNRDHLADSKINADVQPTIRKNFKDTAYWQPDVITAPTRATVKVDLPYNLRPGAHARAFVPTPNLGRQIKVVARKDGSAA